MQFLHSGWLISFSISALSILLLQLPRFPTAKRQRADRRLSLLLPVLPFLFSLVLPVLLLLVPLSVERVLITLILKAFTEGFLESGNERIIS